MAEMSIRLRLNMEKGLPSFDNKPFQLSDLVVEISGTKPLFFVWGAVQAKKGRAA
jgi:hypothetical protein